MGALSLLMAFEFCTISLCREQGEAVVLVHMQIRRAHTRTQRRARARVLLLRHILAEKLHFSRSDRHKYAKFFICTGH